MFRDRFWVALLLTVPILLWGHMVPGLLGFHPPSFPGSQWIAPVLGTAVFLYGGSPFLKGALGELRDRLPGMMVLIALAISVAFVFSVAVELGYPGMPLWEEVATLVTICCSATGSRCDRSAGPAGRWRNLPGCFPIRPSG
jgi:Cu2+-exporting ATPase